MTGSPDDGAVPGRAAPDVPAVPDIPESAAGTGDASGAAPQRAAFRVDLRGMVDLLSRNLYSGPRVYVRELLQNAVDAIAARRALEPGCPGRISIELSRVDGVAALRCADTGIGLTPEQAAGLLSTVGASSKRDELGLARGDYLGQFGIGLLSCFMVSPEIIVTSRSARGSQADPADPPDPPGRIGASAPPGAGGAPGPTVTWAGRTNGTYAVSVVTDPADRLPEPGTVVELISLPGEHWLEPQTVRALVDEFGSLLPVEIEVRDGARVTRHGGGRGPWEMSRHEAIAWCAQELGVTPFDIIDLDVPASGLRGIAVVVTHAHPAAAAHHTAYVKRMLVSRAAEDLAPAWAYFVRVIAGSDHLRPTASRERLVDDEMLEATRRGVGDAVHGWLERTARLTPSRFADFLDAHAVGLRSVALRDEQVLALVARHLPVETTEGALTLTDLVELARPGRSLGPAEGGTIGRPGPAAVRSGGAPCATPAPWTSTGPWPMSPPPRAWFWSTPATPSRRRFSRPSSPAPTWPAPIPVSHWSTPVSCSRSSPPARPASRPRRWTCSWWPPPLSIPRTARSCCVASNPPPCPPSTCPTPTWRAASRPGARPERPRGPGPRSSASPTPSPPPTRPGWCSTAPAHS